MLILVRHSITEPVPGQRSTEWELTEKGRKACKRLSIRLTPYRPDIFITSVEPKAQLTGKLTAEFLGIESKTGEGLHEHERANVPFFERKEDFEAAVKRLFKQPDKRVFGEESADECFTRFNAAVERVVAEYPRKIVAIATHGTVMSLFIDRHSDHHNAAEVWQDLGMPAYAVLDTPSYRVLALVNQV